jgi:hypothetical protein
MEELPDEATARAVKAALPAQPNQPANTRLMARATFVAGVSGLTLCLAGAAGAVTEDQFRLHNTGDLAALCSAATTDPLYTAAINFCHGFGAGTYGVLAEAQQADAKLRLFCPPEGITRNEAVAAFVSWAGADPARVAMPATDGVTAFLTQTYPCPGATRAAPGRRRTQ